MADDRTPSAEAREAAHEVEIVPVWSYRAVREVDLEDTELNIALALDDFAARRNAELMADIEQLRIALTQIVYETTNLSIELGDGSHCTNIGFRVLTNARIALKDTAQ